MGKINRSLLEWKKMMKGDIEKKVNCLVKNEEKENKNEGNYNI